MRQFSRGFAGFALLALGLGTANAQDKVKIGIILPYSGHSPTPPRRWTTPSSFT